MRKKETARIRNASRDIEGGRTNRQKTANWQQPDRQRELLRQTDKEN